MQTYSIKSKITLSEIAIRELAQGKLHRHTLLESHCWCTSYFYWKGSIFLHIGRVLNSLSTLAAEGAGRIDPSTEVDELCAGDAHGLVVAGPCVSGNVVVARALRVEQQPVLHVSERSNC